MAHVKSGRELRLKGILQRMKQVNEIFRKIRQDREKRNQIELKLNN